MTNFRRWRAWLPYLLLIPVLVGSGTLPGAPLLSGWESSTVFTTFGVRESALSLGVAPLANIGGSRYALLEVTRPMMAHLGLHPSLATLRLPVIICGVIALIFFFILACRWFGAWPALGATALLAVNPIFTQYQHELIIAGPSFMALLIFLERLQALAGHRGRWLNWVTLGASLVLVLLLYGPGRILAVIVLALTFAYWAAPMLRARDYLNLGRYAVSVAAFATGVVVGLLLLDRSNARFLGPSLLFPRTSETLLVTDSPISTFTTFVLNARIEMESLLMGGGENHAQTLEATLAHQRFAVIPLVIVPIYLIGMIYALIQILLAKALNRERYVFILGLAVLTTVPLLTSTVAPAAPNVWDVLDSSISPYRMSYFLIPAYLAAAVTLSWLFGRTAWTQCIGVVVVLSLLITGIAFIVEGRSNFAKLLASVEPSLRGDNSYSQWLSGRQQIGYEAAAASHLQQHAQYARWAKIKAAEIPSDLGSNVTVVVPTSIACFSEAPLHPGRRDFYDVNYHNVFLSLYLSEELPNVSVGHVLLVPPGGATRSFVQKEGVYSAQLSAVTPTTYDYESFDSQGSRIMALDEAPEPQVIIATTPKELAFTLDELEKEGRTVSLSSSSAGC